MSLPQILVIDDQFALDEDERQIFIDHSGLFDSKRQAGNRKATLAEAVFSSGQRHKGKEITNDYQVIQRTVADGPPNGKVWSLILLDVRFDSGRVLEIGLPEGRQGDDHFGEDVRRRLAADFPELPVVMLSSKQQLELRDSDKIHYLSKTGLTPHVFTKCLLSHGLLTTDQRLALLALPKGVTAHSPATLTVFLEALSLAITKTSVLILGETGTGKDVLSHYIHDHSPRADKPFIPINVAAISPELIESELFGHEKGAFTGAIQKRPGCFIQANGGTLFLDEIGDMSASLQAKILRVLQDGEVLPVGGTNSIKVDVRIIAATSRDLASMQQAGTFRIDLVRRIADVTLTMPPLRERREDIAPLAKLFLDIYSREYAKEGISIDEKALATLETHPFQGNVGELQSIVKGLVCHKGNHSVISKADVQEAMAGSFISARPVPPETPKVVPSQSAGSGLAELAKLIESWPIFLDDPSLNGGKTLVEQAVCVLQQRMAGAALELFRDPRNGSMNRQASMQFLTGDETLKGKGPGRVINEILGQKKDEKFEDDRLLELVNFWRQKNHDDRT